MTVISDCTSPDSPDCCEEGIEWDGASKSKVVAVDFALDLGADDTVFLRVHLVQHHS